MAKLRLFGQETDFVPYTSNDQVSYPVFQRFVKNETNGGIVLVLATIVSVLIATFCGEAFEEFLETPVGVSFAGNTFALPVEKWINDVLMALFFFVVGLEIKREILVGQLSSSKKAILPFLGALGGMILPAIIYALANIGSPETLHGWGIPMATDIAFAVGILSLLGSRVPVSLKIFLTALAVVDDLGSIIVLAVFYPSSEIQFIYLLIALGVLVLIALYNHFVYYRAHQNIMFPYIFFGIALWVLIYLSGVHATIAGVLLAVMIPAKTKLEDKVFIAKASILLSRFKHVCDDSGDILTNNGEQEVIQAMSREINKFDPMLHRFESALHPFSTFIIMPVFALANANVALDFSVFSHGVPVEFIGIFLGLFIGKPVGIFLMSMLGVRLGLADMPAESTKRTFFAVAMLGGIGFTMSIFVNSLAFAGNEALTDIGKMSILITSVFVAAAGYAACRILCKK